jgi:hypothetical protein
MRTSNKKKPATGDRQCLAPSKTETELVWVWTGGTEQGPGQEQGQEQEQEQYQVVLKFIRFQLDQAQRPRGCEPQKASMIPKHRIRI